MPNQTNLAEQRVPLNWLQLIFIIGFIVSITFTVSNIYNKFELDRVEIKKLKSEIKTVKDDLNRRIDIKTFRNEEMIKKLHSK